MATKGLDDGFLAGVRILEVGGELVEYCGKLLAGLGADVIKVEPPQGEETRSYGPFLDDTPDAEGSLHFWHYNFGKRGITLDLESEAGRTAFRELADSVDLVLDGRPHGYLAARGLDYAALSARNPRILVARISPFGDDGPWQEFHGSDLVHLALGGVVTNCGYDSDPQGSFETPPVAPQMWQAYQIAGEVAVMGILGALFHQLRTGEGQYLSTSVHSAVAQQTEGDVPSWIFLRHPHYRQTCRHSRMDAEPAVLAMTKDGRYLFPYMSYAHTDPEAMAKTIAILDKYGMAEDLTEAAYSDPQHLAQMPVKMHITGVVNRFIQSFMFDRDIWMEFQAAGMTWSPVRRPEENVGDAHWQSRQTFLDVERPERGRSFKEVGAKWLCPQVSWRTGPRSPLLGEHNQDVLGPGKPSRPSPVIVKDTAIERLDAPAALDGVRFIDLGWMLASAGAGRFLAAMGADVVKVEHKTRWDALRWTRTVVPLGLRGERDAATDPLPIIRPTSPNRCGFFMDINAGKHAISLNVKDPRGKKLLTRLLRDADVVAEGFSPGTMDRMGFGYDRLKEINPRLVYVQQSGMGQIGVYGQLRSYGPVAQAFSGISDMSGLAEPFPPAGIGYSYLDWFGAYNLATAILAGLYRQKMTGEGCWIDSSQVEAGTYLVGTSILDHDANGRRWARYGNRSPYKLAAPHGIFRTAGEDRWIAISCFSEDHWRSLTEILGEPALTANPAYATLQGRIAHQDGLERAVNSTTQAFDGYMLMAALQRSGVPAGVCQTAEDRCDHDPQLASQNWLVDLPQTEIGIWPAKEFPVRFSRTPSPIGGKLRRHGPNYAEDNEAIFGEWLGLSTAQIRELEQEGVL